MEQEIKDLWGIMSLDVQYKFFLHNEPNAEYSSLKEGIEETSLEETKEAMGIYIESLLESSELEWLLAELAKCFVLRTIYNSKR